jgi:hypothetical protein
LKNLILELDMNMIDLDPHLHFHMELLLYLDLAPDPFMLQPQLPLVPGKIPLGQLTDRGLYLQRMVLLLYFPLLSQLFVLGLGKLDLPGMDPNHKLAMGLALPLMNLL